MIIIITITVITGEKTLDNLPFPPLFWNIKHNREGREPVFKNPPTFTFPTSIYTHSPLLPLSSLLLDTRLTLDGEVWIGFLLEFNAELSFV
jgi:hypothetical protein